MHPVTINHLIACLCLCLCESFMCIGTPITARINCNECLQIKEKSFNEIELIMTHTPRKRVLDSKHLNAMPQTLCCDEVNEQKMNRYRQSIRPQAVLISFCWFCSCSCCLWQWMHPSLESDIEAHQVVYTMTAQVIQLPSGNVLKPICRCVYCRLHCCLYSFCSSLFSPSLARKCYSNHCARTMNQTSV